MQRIAQGFPDAYRVPMRCTTNFVLAGNLNNYISYKGNGVYATGPNVNNGGYNSNVPAGIAALFKSAEAAAGDTAPYVNYRVHGSRIVVLAAPTGGGPVTRMVVFPCRIDAATIGASNFNQIGEQPYACTRVLPPTQNIPPQAVTCDMLTTKLFGEPSNFINDANFGANGTGMPVFGWYWNIYFFGDGATNVQINASVTIDYDIEFYGRANLLSTIP